MPVQLAPVSYEPIRAVKVLGQQGALPAMTRQTEGATQTFKTGVPLVLSSGNVIEASFSGAETIFGVAAEAGHNLAVAATGAELSAGTPQNQASAKIIPVGAPISDGRIGVYHADGATVFSVALKLGQVYTEAMMGVAYGLTKDVASGFWYLDNTDTSGDNVVAVCVGNDSSAPNSATLGARVFFQFISTLRVFK